MRLPGGGQGFVMLWLMAWVSESARSLPVCAFRVVPTKGEKSLSWFDTVVGVPPI